jgi:signal peptidase I
MASREVSREPTGRKSRRAAQAAPAPKPSARQSALEWLRSLAVAVVLFLVIRTFLVQTFTITSGSMIPSLLVGDWLMISKVTYGPQIPFTHGRLPGYRQPRLHDIVVFRPPTEPNLDVVKRIVAVGGDTIEMRGGRLYRNGRFADGPYVIHTDPNDDQTSPMMMWQRRYLLPGVDAATYSPSRDDWGPIVVPPGQLFMMGDNRDDSLDSRYWGFLDPARIEGNVMFIYYSYDEDSTRPLPFLTAIRWGRIGHIVR